MISLLDIYEVVKNTIRPLCEGEQYFKSGMLMCSKPYHLTNPVIEKFSAKFHSLIKFKLYCVNITDKQLEHIFISQPKIKCLELEGINTLDKPNFDKLNEQVETISLNECFYMEIDYTFIRCLNKFKHLKKLQICTIKTLRINKLVREIPQIEHLEIRIFVHYDEVLRDIGVLKNLRSLNLEIPDSITDYTMAAIAENCRLLECIIFELIDQDYLVTSEGLKRLSELPELKKITMPGMKQINDEVLEIWARNRKLTHVNIFGSDNITDKSVITVLEQCPHLQELSVEYCNITKAALFKAVEVAERRPLTPLLHIFFVPYRENLQIDTSKYQNTCLEFIIIEN